MACRTNRMGWIVSSALIWALVALSCSAEKKGGSTSTIGNVGANSDQQGAAEPGTNAGANTGSNVGNIPNTGAADTKQPVLADGVCAGANARALRIKPTVLFVVDRSGSTADPYPGSTSKWQAMYDALMTPKEGVISKLQSVAEFGMVLFDGGDLGGMAIATGVIGIIACVMDPAACLDAAVPAGDGGQSNCPRTVIINPAIDNRDAIDAKYSVSLPGGTTPTTLALQRAYALLPDQQTLDKQVGPRFVIFCTDGLPNYCDSLENDFLGPIDELKKAAQRGIKTYVVGVAAKSDSDAGGTVNAQAYLDELATYGNTGSPAFSPATKGDLVASLTQIIGGAVGCNVKLNGSVVVGQECSGKVELNSKPLECNGANGFKLVSANEIELQGTSCKKFTDDPMAIVSATFPCAAFVLE
jgi:hypothetical protein